MAAMYIYIYIYIYILMSFSLMNNGKMYDISFFFIFGCFLSMSASY